MEEMSHAVIVCKDPGQDHGSESCTSEWTMDTTTIVTDHPKATFLEKKDWKDNRIPSKIDVSIEISHLSGLVLC